MANIRFRLNKGLSTPDKEKKYPIYIRYRVGSKVDFNASIGFKVLPEWWNSDYQKVKRLAVVKNYHEINGLITKLTSYFDDYDNSNRRIGKTPSYKDVRKHFDNFFIEPEENTDKLSLFDSIEELVQFSDENGIVKPGTIRGYKTTQNILLEFSNKKYKLTFENMDMEFYYDFVNWCQNNKKHGINYIGKNIKNIKKFMSYALEKGYSSNRAFESNKFKVIKENVHHVYLTESELFDLWKLDLTHMPNHERARDLFLIGAYTGLRVSDFNRLKEKNLIDLEGKRTIYIIQEKTGQEAYIPIHPLVQKILDKNGGLPPKRLPDQKINELIKEVAESAGIDTVEYITKTIAGKKATQRKYKFELIVTHTARRSFCTNAYKRGMGTLEIMKISGHKTESAFMKYIKMTAKDAAIKMSEHAFFKGLPQMKIVS